MSIFTFLFINLESGLGILLEFSVGIQAVVTGASVQLQDVLHRTEDSDTPRGDRRVTEA